MGTGRLSAAVPGSGASEMMAMQAGFGSARMYSSYVSWLTPSRLTSQMVRTVVDSVDAKRRANVSPTICSARTCSRLNLCGRRKS